MYLANVVLDQNVPACHAITGNTGCHHSEQKSVDRVQGRGRFDDVPVQSKICPYLESGSIPNLGLSLLSGFVVIELMTRMAA